MDFSPLALMLIPAVVGYTEAIKDQFPVISKLVPLIAVLVSFLLYAAHRYLNPDLFMTIYGAGAGMGFYTGAKAIGTVNLTR